MKNRRLFLFFFLALTFSACSEPGSESTPPDKPISEDADTMVPPADSAKGMDNVIGYRAVQHSTEYEDLLPLPPEVKRENQLYPVYLPDYTDVDFSPERYSYRYLIRDEGPATVEGMEGIEERPPLFDESCTLSGEPVNCSNAKLRAYLNKEGGASEEGELVFGFITLDEKGALERIDRIELADGAVCADCRARARVVLNRMPDWTPARIEGTAVKSQVVVPLYL